MVSTIRPALTFSYAIAGRTLSIETSDDWSANFVSRYLRDFHLDPIPSGTSNTPAAFTIRVFSTERPPDVPPGLETFEIAFGNCHTDGSQFYLSVEDSFIATGIDGVTDSLSVWVGDTAHARQSLSLANLMSYALEMALRRCALYQIHGAGLVTPDSKHCMLILGASGSGKSTLTALLASRGWLYLTDDALLLNQAGGSINARGIRRFFSASDATLASSTIQNFTEAVGQPMLSDPFKRRVEPELAFPDQFVQSCVPKTVVFASIAETTASEICVLSRTDTMARLIRMNPWASYDRFTSGNHLHVLNQLTNQCRAFALQAGRDLLDDPFCAESLLRPLLSRTA